MLKLTTLVCLFLLISSCVHIRSKIRVDSEFEGLSNRYSHQSFQPETQYSLVIHGIGPQKNTYADKIIENLSKQLGDFEFIDSMSFNTGSETILNRFRYGNAASQKEAIFYVVKWSDLTEQSKNRMISDETKLEGAFHGLSKPIKKALMYKRVADAFYGQDKDFLNPILNTIDLAYNDIQSQLNDKALDNLNLISGSFGSQVFIKYLYEKQKASINEAYDLFGFTGEEINQDTLSLLSFDNKFTGTTLNFYMLTNQLALMEGNIQNWGDSTLINQGFRVKEVNAVAFRNTNDFLCFYLPKDKITPFFKCSDQNIHVTNSFYWNFLIKNDPLSAHTSVFKSKKLAKAITHGSKSKRVKVLRRKTKI